jgi:aspartyl-tRNA(Asn)/glutamyl-tRNA(Gln) amidotransferase subunit C
MELTSEDVRKVALLSRLELTDEEIETQRGHLNGLLAQFEKLQELDTDGLEPTSHPFPMTNVLRDDVLAVSLPRDAVLANAPEKRDGCFVVPRIMEGQ